MLLLVVSTSIARGESTIVPPKVYVGHEHHLDARGKRMAAKILIASGAATLVLGGLMAGLATACRNPLTQYQIATGDRRVNSGCGIDDGLLGGGIIAGMFGVSIATVGIALRFEARAR